MVEANPPAEPPPAAPPQPKPEEQKIEINAPNMSEAQIEAKFQEDMARVLAESRSTFFATNDVFREEFEAQRQAAAELEGIFGVNLISDLVEN